MLVSWQCSYHLLVQDFTSCLLFKIVNILPQMQARESLEKHNKKKC